MLAGLLAAVFIFSWLLAWRATPLAGRWARRAGLVDAPDGPREAGGRKRQAGPVPYGGGWAIFLSFNMAVGAAWIGGIVLRRLFLDGGDPDIHGRWPLFFQRLLDLSAPYLGGLTLDKAVWTGAGLLAGGAGMFALGCWDDRSPLPAGKKFLWQALFAAFPVAAGVRLALPVGPDLLAAVATWFWIVAITNAFNLLDNMDGLSAGVAGLAAALFVFTAAGNGQVFVAGALAALSGAAFGFLRHNFAPATVYMGDAGSLFLGYALATLTAATMFYAGAGGLYALAAPVLALGVPIYDTATVMAVRWRRKQPLWHGDRNHLSHRLTRLGMSVREAVLTIYLLGLIMGGLSALLLAVTGAWATVTLFIGMGILALVALLERVGRRNG